MTIHESDLQEIVDALAADGFPSARSALLAYQRAQEKGHQTDALRAESALWRYALLAERIDNRRLTARVDRLERLMYSGGPTYGQP